jgi:Kef-type K+ transport system membrane component KefB
MKAHLCGNIPPMKAPDYLLFFLQILLLLVSSRFLGRVFQALRQPAVIGELLAGVLLGPTLFGNLAPESFGRLFPTPEGHLLPPALDAFAMLSVTLLMLAAGLELDLRMVLKEKKLTFFCAAFGSVVPLALGIGAGLWLASLQELPAHVSPLLFAVVLGINLAMSALPVIAKTLLDLGIYRTRIGVVILSAALVDDLAVWILFSFAMGLAGGSTGEGGSTGTTLLLTLLLLAGILTAGRWLASRVVALLESDAWPGGVVSFLVAAGLGAASLALWIGIHPVFGSLLAGVAIGSAPRLGEESKQTVYRFIMAVPAPIFFASIGLRMDFAAHFDLLLVASVFALGCAGKLLGVTSGARLGGLGWRDSFAVAAGLNSRGIMGIILGLVALEHGIIDRPMFVALAALGVGTSLLSGPLLRLSLRREVP